MPKGLLEFNKDSASADHCAHIWVIEEIGFWIQSLQSVSFYHFSFQDMSFQIE